MNRPTVSVVMPFAGDSAAAARAVTVLGTLRAGAGDELILADNSGGAVRAGPGVRVVVASAERSPAHARNAGAAVARGEWLLFLDADCLPPEDLLDRYFVRPVAPDVGALAGEVRAAPGVTVAERYGVARNFLDQRAHLAHPYRPRAVAANLLVRREAFVALSGFLEGLRAAEDTDFTWRLHGAGWRIEWCETAAVEHRYRARLGELRRQWRGYAAGRAWLARRYDGFVPAPAVSRLIRRAGRRSGAAGPPAGGGGSDADRYRFLAVDALLAAEELVGLVLSNRPPGAPSSWRASVVLLAGRFPALGDPLVARARSFAGARVEAAARPDRLDVEAARDLHVTFREDDGLASRACALVWLVVCHPLRCWRFRGASLPALAPAVRRIAGERTASLVPLGSDVAHVIAGLAGVAEVSRRGD